MTVREKILHTMPNIKVRDVLAPGVVEAMPEWLFEAIAPMVIVWLPSRKWGESFKLGAPTISLGHMRGDHIASRPWTLNLSEADAETYLKARLQGVILHEVGHAVVDAFLAQLSKREQARIWNGFRQIVTAEGPVSTYLGMDETSWDDTSDAQLHEVAAEYVRYYFVDDLMVETHPLVCQFLENLLHLLDPANW